MYITVYQDLIILLLIIRKSYLVVSIGVME